MARNAQYGWEYVINTDRYKQPVKMEICLWVDYCHYTDCLIIKYPIFIGYSHLSDCVSCIPLLGNNDEQLFHNVDISSVDYCFYIYS